MSGTEQAIVTDLDEPKGEHVLEEATDELLGTDGAMLELVSGRLFVRESDSALLQFTEAVVTEGDAKDARSEILESLYATANGLAMDHPVFVPDGGRDLSKEIGLFQGVTKLGAEDSGERFDGYQEVFAGRAPATVRSEAAAGDDVMDVGMVEELASPGVEHADHAEASADEARVLGQLQ